VAYDDRTLGELDAEDPVFLSACQSPTGKPGIMFNGAHSGTVSFWEFECTVPDETCTTAGSSSQGGNKNSSDLSGGAIAGIAIGSLVGVAVIVFVVTKLSGRNNAEVVAGKSNVSVVMEESSSSVA
jgi:hypothetical protein